MRSKAELIAYADRFGGDLAGLRALLSGPLQGLFGGVHVLPFYRPFDGADAGSIARTTPRSTLVLAPGMTSLRYPPSTGSWPT